ncbi:MAG: hypothetical protein QM478_07740 [Flavobacteriaceae bacterium]
MIKTQSIFIFCITLMLISCKTYTVSPESFKKQMKNANSNNLKEVEINNPLGYNTIPYYSNNIGMIKVIDKDGNEKLLYNSPSIEMRVTLNNKKKYVFYFDTVILENDTLKGHQSRFIQSLTKEIPLDSIMKIEIQDGKKKFEYQ